MPTKESNSTNKYVCFKLLSKQRKIWSSGIVIRPVANYHFRSLFMFFVFVLLDGCFPPDVALPAWFPNNKDNAISFRRSQDVILRGIIASEPNCVTTYPRITWKVSTNILNDDGSYSLQEQSFNTLSTELKLSKRTLNHGVHNITFKVDMPSNGLGFETTGYVTIVKSPLIASIVGGSTVSRSNGEPIMLNGSPSRDPDVKPGDHSSMAFTWLCKKQYESFPYESDVSNIPIVTPDTGPSQWGGCFGTGVGRLNSSDITTTLDSSKLTVGYTYIIKLIVTKDDRQADFNLSRE